jgi:1-acyl-sn-glycerol-3-phosphate acyltransferase
MAGARRAPEGSALFWSALKWVVLGPLLRLLWRPRTEGLANIPAAGGAILAANHVSFLDPLLLPLVVPRRRVMFLAKSRYIDKRYLGWFLRGVGVIPVSPQEPGGVADAVSAGVAAVRAGHLVGIFPEGTRSPDGQLRRGKTGVARIALAAGVPVIPAAIIGTGRAFPRGARLPRPCPVRIRFGPPVTLTGPRPAATPAPGPAAVPDATAAREATDQVMAAIARLAEDSQPTA